MAAQVEGDDAPARQPLRQPAEAEPVGVDAMQADDRGALGIPQLVRVEDQSSVSSPLPDGW